jgi:hypothetical protein
MIAPRLARAAARWLADRSSMPARPPTPQDRVSAISAIEHAIAARAAKRRRARWARGLAAAAAIAVAALGGARLLLHRPAPVAVAPSPPPAEDLRVVAHPVVGSATVLVSGASAPITEGRALVAGSRVMAPPDARLLLAFSTGTSALLEDGADVTLAAAGVSQVLKLDAGAMDLHVSKVKDGERFVVRTSDAEVEVRGTAFRVSVVPAEACGAGTTTRVAVSEGVVVVHRDGKDVRVATGEQWPTGCGAPAIASAATPLASGAPPRSSAAATPASTLAEQNDLFARAVAAKRRGDLAGALRGFDRFLARYPSSALAESAAVERMRILRSTDPGRAVTTARQYLARYPNGFAHAEAEAIVAEEP